MLQPIPDSIGLKIMHEWKARPMSAAQAANMCATKLQQVYTSLDKGDLVPRGRPIHAYKPLKWFPKIPQEKPPEELQSKEVLHLSFNESLNRTRTPPRWATGKHKHFKAKGYAAISLDKKLGVCYCKPQDVHQMSWTMLTKSGDFQILGPSTEATQEEANLEHLFELEKTLRKHRDVLGDLKAFYNRLHHWIQGKGYMHRKIKNFPTWCPIIKAKPHPFLAPILLAKLRPVISCSETAISATANSLVHTLQILLQHYPHKTGEEIIHELSQQQFAGKLIGKGDIQSCYTKIPQDKIINNVSAMAKRHLGPSHANLVIALTKLHCSWKKFKWYNHATTSFDECLQVEGSFMGSPGSGELVHLALAEDKLQSRLLVQIPLWHFHDEFLFIHEQELHPTWLKYIMTTHSKACVLVNSQLTNLRQTSSTSSSRSSQMASALSPMYGNITDSIVHHNGPHQCHHFHTRTPLPSMQICCNMQSRGHHLLRTPTFPSMIFILMWLMWVSRKDSQWSYIRSLSEVQLKRPTDFTPLPYHYR